MKSLKSIAGIFACASILLTGCEKEFKAGEDTTKPVPTDLQYDVEYSRPDTMAVCWNAAEAIAAGATSFNVELCDSPDDAVNTYDDNILTVKVSSIGADGIAHAVFTKGTKEHSEKYARIRANYGAVFSKWAFATDKNGDPAVLISGHGMLDKSKACFENIVFKDNYDGTFEVSADASAASGADSLIVYLMDYASSKALDKQVVPAGSTSFSHKFEGLTDGKLYQLKFLAEYKVSGAAPHTNYIYAEGDAKNEEGETVTSNVIQCGKGFAVVNGVPPSVRLKSKYSGMLVFEWSVTTFGDNTKDAATPVKVALYDDASCKEEHLVYGWTISKYELPTNIADKQPAISFANLKPGTKYWFTCQDQTTGLLSDALEAETSGFNIVQVGTTPAAAGETVLAENFSELYFGGNSIDFTATPENNNNALTHPEEGKWDSTNLKFTDPNHGFFNTIGKSGGVKNSRFKDWAVIHGAKDGTGSVGEGDCCIRTGMLQMGAASGIPIVFTPKLTNLEGLATVKVTYTISSMWEKGAIKEAGDADFKSIGIYVAEGGKTSTSGSSYGTLTGASVKQVAAIDRPATKEADGTTALKAPAWEKRTVTIKNVAQGARIGIGTIRPEGKTGNQRFLLSGVTVSVVSYGEPELFTPVLKETNIGKTKATLTFEAQDFAKEYILGYKKSGDAEYKFIDSPTPEITIKPLEVNTTYFIKAYCKSGEYESPAFYYEFKTGSVDYTYPLDINNLEEFLEWMSAGAEYTTAGQEINLKTDIDLAGVTAEQLLIVPEFEGTLNGNNHVIKNWTSTHGLFRKMNGSVKDLTIDASCSFSGSEYLAPIALSGSGSISNVHNKAKVSYSADNFTETVAIAGIAVELYGKIENCSNTAEITAKSNGSMKGVAAAGLVDYLCSEMSNCTNEGNISISGVFVNGNTTLGANVNVVPNAGGLVALGGTGFEMKSCDNRGKVSLTLTAIEKTHEAKKSLKRQSVGGVVASPNGNISKCNNYGTIEVNASTTNHEKYPSYVDSKKKTKYYEHIILAGGISSGDYQAKGQDASNIIDCRNEGNIIFYTDYDGSNNAVGGIVGWPGLEDKTVKQTIVTENCKNIGSVTVKGNGKVRVGGIQGGSGNIVNCENTGNITVESGAANACAVGSIAGFHSNGHKIEDSKAYGTVTAKVEVVGIGGLVGNNGNIAQTTGDGCVVDCTIIGGTTENAGMIIGALNGNTTKIEMGTKTAIKVAGTLNGVAVTSENLKDCLHGTKNYKEEMHIFNAVFGK